MDSRSPSPSSPRRPPPKDMAQVNAMDALYGPLEKTLAVQEDEIQKELAQEFQDETAAQPSDHMQLDAVTCEYCSDSYPNSDFYWEEHRAVCEHEHDKENRNQVCSCPHCTEGVYSDKFDDHLKANEACLAYWHSLPITQKRLVNPDYRTPQERVPNYAEVLKAATETGEGRAKKTFPKISFKLPGFKKMSRQAQGESSRQAAPIAGPTYPLFAHPKFCRTCGLPIESAAIGGYENFVKKHESQCLAKVVLNVRSTRRYDAQTGLTIVGEQTRFSSDEILGAVEQAPVAPSPHQPEPETAPLREVEPDSSPLHTSSTPLPDWLQDSPAQTIPRGNRGRRSSDGITRVGRY